VAEVEDDGDDDDDDDDEVLREAEHSDGKFFFIYIQGSWHMESG
jgi:hypothetical protein